MAHHFESRLPYHHHNTPCELCGKTSRHSNHRVVPPPKVYASEDRNCCSYHRTGGAKEIICTPANGERA